MIGIFDSGLGGLTVVKQLKKHFPQTSFYYLGDTQRVPYGTRSVKTIRQFAKENTLFLVGKKVDLIIVACNTVSAVGLDVVRKNSNVPVIGVIEPALRKARKLSKNNKIGLIGTRATVNSKAYKGITKRNHATLLIPLIEEGYLKKSNLKPFFEMYLKRFKGSVDTLILGCTHYPIIKTSIQKYLGKNVKLVDPAQEVVKEVSKFLKKDKKQKEKYYLTDLNERFLKIAKDFLGYSIGNKTEKVNL